MEIVIFDPQDDLGQLADLFLLWEEEANSNDFSIPLGLENAMMTARLLIENQASDLIGAFGAGGELCGFMGLRYERNHIGPGLFAGECLFFVNPKRRGAGVQLAKAAKLLAKARGCSHIIFNASKLAGDAERAGALYERLGGKPLETAYIMELA